MKDRFQQLLKDEGCAIKATNALFRAMREERGIYLRVDALPEIFSMKGTESSNAGSRYTSESIRAYAAKHELVHPEDVIQHLQINGTSLECTKWLTEHPLLATFIDFDKTMRHHPEFSKDDAYETSRTYMNYLLKNGIVTARERLSDIMPATVLRDLKEPPKTFDLNLDFALLLSTCPSWVETHPNRPRYLLGLEWYDDSDKLLERKIKAIGYRNLSHGMCPDCDKKFNEELTQEN